ncbi:MAG: ABC transporter permease [Psychrilyobacter sp.]|nr:ABC transporter permease [Psychrilyobacter sp.]
MIFFIVKKILLENKLRTATPLMGIIIGVASIMGIFAISSGGQLAVQQDLASIAENRVMVNSDNGFDREDIKFVEDLPMIKYVFSPDMSLNIEQSQNGMDNKIKIEGYTKKAIKNKNLEIKNGSSNLNGENILISEQLANKIYGNTDVIGKTIELKITSYRVEKFRILGVYKEDLQETFGNSTIYLDIDKYQDISDSRKSRNLVITYFEDEDAEESSEYVIELLSRKNYQNHYSILEGNSKYKKIEKIKNMINMFLGAIGVVALLMGGLGVSNLLLNMVREMTPSIGILRTMGISSKSILEIFLVKSVILSTIGGFFGVVFGCLGAYIVGRLIGIPSIYYISQIITVFITSVVMGVIFGSFPAWKASKMDIVEALNI